MPKPFTGQFLKMARLFSKFDNPLLIELKVEDFIFVINYLFSNSLICDIAFINSFSVQNESINKE